MVLRSLQSDLSALGKQKDFPFTRVYELNDTDSINIQIDKSEDDSFHLKLTTPDGCRRASEPKLKRLVNLAYVFTWGHLASALKRSPMHPCAAMAHGGADEILALYECCRTLKDYSGTPFVQAVNGARGDYKLVSVEQRGMMHEIAIETNHIYGNSMKWKAEVEFTHQVVERVNKIIAEALSEWLRPGTASLRAELEREMQTVNPRQKNTFTRTVPQGR